MFRKKRLILFVLAMLITTSVLALAAETVTVITKENAIRASCRFFAPVVATVRYNDRLEVLSKEGDWYRVRFKDVEGCIHKSAVEKPKIALADLGIGDKKSTTEDEVALAGKGFNPQVEDAYKDKNPEISFQQVDSIEAYGIPEEKQIEFIEEGELNLP